MFLKLSRFFLHTSLFSVVIVMTSTFFPFIGGKYYFFRVSVELALIFFILWWAFETKAGEIKERLERLFSQPLFIAVSIFVLIYLLASIFANDTHAAFWSNYERGEGGFQMIHYYIFFVLLLLAFDKKENWLTVFRFSLAAAILMILYGVAANFSIRGFISPYQGNIPPTAWGKLTVTRFQGSLGNPAYVAPYLMFTLFYTLYLWANRAWKNKIVQGLIYGGLGVIFFFFFIISQTRGAFVGLIAATIVFLASLVFFNSKLKKLLLVVLAAFIVVGGLLFYYREAPIVKSLPGSRVLELSLSETAFKTRFWTWNTAWRGFKERPILGWGPENFSTVFDKYFDPRHYVPGKNTETWFDRAHSVIFDYLTETGLLGLLSFLGLFFVFYISFIKKFILKKKDFHHLHLNGVQKGLLTSLPIAYLIQGIALFDVLPIYLNLFLFLAFSGFVLSSYFSKEGKELISQSKEKIKNLPEVFKKVIAIVVAAVILAVAYYGSYLPLRKSQMFISALNSDRKIQSLDEFKKVFSAPLDVPSPIGQEELVRNLGNVILNLVSQSGGSRPEVAGELIKYLESYFDPVIERGRGMSFEQDLYILGALNELAFIQTKQTQYLVSAKRYFSKALELGPKRPQALYGMFDIYRIEGNTEEAKIIGEQILTQWPDDNRTRDALQQFLSEQSKALTKPK
ncbi:MAG: O-antigen ligase family protein [Candidatus Liptonbacteria bacterium]|nr:O-antigen ligase family protein [Candidatus Liptonbacteria bacterium]